MEGSAETGVEAGRFVEDTAASAIGKIAEKEGGKAGKVAAQSVAQGVFQGVEQFTEWMIGTRKEADPGAIAKKMGEEAIGAIFKELVAGQLKPLFKSAFGSYLDKSVSDAALKTMGLTRDAFMTAGQKFLAEFAAGQGAGLIKSAIAKLISRQAAQLAGGDGRRDRGRADEGLVEAADRRRGQGAHQGSGDVEVEETTLSRAARTRAPTAPPPPRHQRRRRQRQHGASSVSRVCTCTREPRFS